MVVGPSQDLEAPGRLVLVVEAVGGVEVELPGGGGGSGGLLVVQAVGGVEGQPGAAVTLMVVVMVMMVVVARALAQRVVVVVAGHRGGPHGAELVGMVVGVHGRQVGAAIHAPEIGRGGRRGVTLPVPAALAIGDGVAGRGGSGGRAGPLHAGRGGRRQGLRHRHPRRRSAGRDGSRAPDGRRRGAERCWGTRRSRRGRAGGGRRG